MHTIRIIILLSFLLTLRGVVPPKSYAAEPCQLTWQVVPSPNVGLVDHSLNGVAALAPNDVWAVGYTFENGTFHSLMLHWDGTIWSIYPVPDVGAIYSGIEVIATNDMWVGGDNPLHWNGTEWQVVAAPKAITHLSALASDDIWATSDDSGVLHWDGMAWTSIAFPLQPSNALLRDIHALNADDVWVIGHYYGQPQTFPIVYHWNGVEWAPKLLPQTSNVTVSGLDGTANDLWLVGGYTGDIPLAITNHWNGTEWVSVESQELFPFYTGSGSMGFLDVWWSSKEEVWAVGLTHSRFTRKVNPLIEYWDGTEWRVQKTPILISETSLLLAVTANDATEVWAVGYTVKDGVYQTLTLHGTPPCVPWERLVPKHPKLEAPADGVVYDHLPITFEWARVNKATFYFFNLRHGQRYIKSKLVKKRRVRVRRLQEGAGKYSWRVLACNDYGCSDWSQARWFTYAPDSE